MWSDASSISPVMWSRFFMARWRGEFFSLAGLESQGWNG
jgi:hypothetical protein